MQGFGVAEGRPKEHLKNMANAAGQSCRDYTPPEGETLDQVSQTQIVLLEKEENSHYKTQGQQNIACATAPCSVCCIYCISNSEVNVVYFLYCFYYGLF